MGNKTKTSGDINDYKRDVDLPKLFRKKVI